MPQTSLPEAIDLSVKRRLEELHTCLPAKIISYDHTQQRATVQPQLKKRYLDSSVEEMPIIVDVPIIWPRSSNASLTFPVTEGDYLLLLFAERSIERFLALGGNQEPGDRRKFDLSDAIGIMGLSPFNVPSRAKNNTDVTLIYNDSSIAISKDGNINIESSKDVNMTVKADANITVDGATKLNSKGDVDIEAPNVNITGNLTVTGNTELMSTLDVTGVTTLDDSLNVEGNTELSQNLSVTGMTDLAGGGQGIAREGDSVQINVIGGSSSGVHMGTITSGSANSKSG